MALKSIKDVVETVKRPEKIIQFGEGGFLRAFVDWQIDIVNEKTDFNGNDCSPRNERRKADCGDSHNQVHQPLNQPVHELR